MIGVFAFFGTLIAIGTVADVILNILKLDIIPEKFLQVTNPFLFVWDSFHISILVDFPSFLSL